MATASIPVPAIGVHDRSPVSAAGLAAHQVSDEKTHSAVDGLKRRVVKYGCQYRTLLWKNILIRRRSPFLLGMELVFPLLFIFVLVGFRTQEKAYFQPACHVQSQSMPSMGLLHYTQSLLCNFNYTCYPKDPEPLTLLEKESPFSYFLRNLTDVIASQELLDFVSFTDKTSRLDQFLTLMSLKQKLSSLMTSYRSVRDSYGNSLSMMTEPDFSLDAIKDMSVLICGGESPNENDIGRFINLVQSQSLVNWTDFEQHGPRVQDSADEKISSHPGRQRAKRLNLCNWLEYTFTLKPIYKTLGRLRHFLFGQVAYYPHSPLIKELIYRTNRFNRFFISLRALIKEYFNGTSLSIQDFFSSNSSNFLTLRGKLFECSQNLQFISSDLSRLCCSAWLWSAPNPNRSSSPCSSLPDFDSHWSKSIETIDFVLGILEELLDCMKLDDKTFLFDDHRDFMSFLSESQEDSLLHNPVGVIFENLTFPNSNQSTNFHSIVIRKDPFSIDTTYRYKTVDHKWNPAPRRNPETDMKYFTSGFIDVQEDISQSIISLTATKLHLATDDLLSVGTVLKLFPVPPYLQDRFLHLFAVNLPQLMVLAWSLTVVSTVKHLVDERERGLHEMLQILGVPSALIQMSWLTVSLCLSTITSLPILVIFKFCRILPNSDPLVVFCFIFSYTLTLLSFALIWSAVFTRANLAAVVAGCVYFLLAAPAPVLIRYENLLAREVLLGASILPQVSYSFGWIYFVRLEVAGSGLQWSNVNFTDNLGGPYSVGLAFVLLWTDSLFQLFLALCVIPWAKSLYFTFYPWYSELAHTIRVSVFGLKSSDDRHLHEGASNLDEFAQKSGRKSQPFLKTCSISPIPRRASIVLTNLLNKSETAVSSRQLNPSIQIDRLSKLYSRTRSFALEEISISFYPNEIAALLGHNGAGKTTLLSILMGIIKPSSGIVKINDINIQQNRERIRRSLGYCPQRDILYPDLTVAEHIWLYGVLKNFTRLQMTTKLDSYLSEFGFQAKRNSLAKDLSGGQRRKLSVCLAFLNSPLVVLLDEPTAGIDPLSKRIVWDAIFSLRNGRTILFTSHHMREAEFLSDQITILSNGRIRYDGPVVLLKAKFGAGYRLTLDKGTGTFRGSEHTTEVVRFVQKFVPEARLVEENFTNWIFHLPHEGALSGQYVRLLENLEKVPQEQTEDILSFSRFSLSDNSLDDVLYRLMVGMSDESGKDLCSAADLTDSCLHFDSTGETDLRLAPDTVSRIGNSQLSDEHILEDPPALCPLADNTGGSSGVCAPEINNTTSGLELIESTFFVQFAVVLIKRYYHVLRNKMTWLFVFTVPCALVLVAAILLTLYRPDIQQPLMEISPWLMVARKGTHLVHFFSYDPRSGANPSAIDLATSVSSVYASAFANPLSWTGSCCLSRQFHSPRPSFIPSCNNKWKTKNWVQLSEDVGGEEGFNRTPFSVRQLPTNDWLLNLSNASIPDHLLNGGINARGEYFGGIEFLSPHSNEGAHLYAELFTAAHRLLVVLNRHLPGNKTFFLNETTDLGLQDVLRLLLPPTKRVRIWYNNRGYPSSVSYLNLFHNMQLRLLTLPNQSSSSSDPPVGLIFANHPLPFPRYAWFVPVIATLKVEAAFILFLLVALSFIPSNFATLIISERQLGLKHLQRVSGLCPFSYWLGSFCCDLALYLGPASALVVILALFQKAAYTSLSVVFPFVLVIFLYGCAMIPLVYLIALLFRNQSTGFVSICAINMLIGSVTLSINFLLNVLVMSHASLRYFAQNMSHILLIFPHYCLGSTMFHLALNRFLIDQNLFPNHRSFSAWVLLYPEMLCLLVESLCFFSLILLLDYDILPYYFHLIKSYFMRVWSRLGYCGSFPSGVSVDNRTATEHDAVPMQNDGNSPQSAFVLVRNLSKRYRGQSCAALNNLNLSIYGGECYGLLGTNGAGKSTTFAMLTGQFYVPPNTIVVNGFDLAHQTSAVYRNLGYCPQKNALHDFLTARETLLMYGRLRLLSGVELISSVNYLLDSTGLSLYADRLVHTFSGGTKRKLSTAVAFIGDPKIVLLDEPSTGMDPCARRMLWSLVRSTLKRNHIVILSSHCMEECEILCTRIGLLHDGRLHCEGHPLELKVRFGVSYLVDYELSPTAATLDPTRLESQMRQYLPKLTLSPNLTVRQQYHHHLRDGPLSHLFAALQKLSESKLITHFSVKISNLEDVFLRSINENVTSPTSELV
ncbi:unnamed protein product [Calicophoron daubneyi]|uniref:ABC transporter domain-containing protein n=1 Tax=Calicophoron daubneyi TaxID=300641 RepID=A0AAV2TPX2_CALDB